MNTRSRCFLLLTIAISASFLADVAKAHDIATELHESFVRLWDSLDHEQQAAIQFEFDDKLRKDWQFVPMERQGLAFGKMKPNQLLAGNVDVANRPQSPWFFSIHAGHGVRTDSA